jgi:hypothetical protein
MAGITLNAIDWSYDFSQRPPPREWQRVAVLRRLLHDHDIGLRERGTAGCLVAGQQAAEGVSWGRHDVTVQALLERPPDCWRSGKP